MIKIGNMNIDKEKIKNKLFYFVCLGSMTFFLVFVADFFFLREANIDVTSNVQIRYTGVNGNATAEVMETAGDINQRTQALLDTVTYTVEPNTSLSNGDIILVTATYDEKIAAQYHYNVINARKEILVEGLSNRYPNIAAIDSEYMEAMQMAANRYVDNNRENIFNLEYDQYDVDEWEAQDAICVYSAFMSSTNSPSADRMIYIYQLDYFNEDNVVEEETEESTDEPANDEAPAAENTEEVPAGEHSTPEENVEEAQPSLLTVYYLVIVPNVNDSNTVDAQNTFGEKVYFTEAERQSLNFEAYVNRVFGRTYTIEKVVTDQPEQQEEQEPVSQ